MKKFYLTMTTLLLSAAAFAQTNLALGGTAAATVGNAALAIDDNEGTRWEHPAGDITAETDAVWTLDLGSAQEFNTIQILWETACSKEFNIYVSNDVENFGTPVLHVTDNTAGLHSYKLDAPATARYIKFENTARGTEWGVSFFEFRVFNMAAATLSSIDLQASATTVKVGTPVTLTATGKDQLGGTMAAEGVTFEVAPADAGAVVDGVYTAAKAGTATITAKIGEIVSNAVEVTAYAGDKIDIFTSMSSMVSPLGDGTKTETMVGAFDDNMASVWEMHAGTDNTDEAKAYETGFVIDLQAYYDITALSVTFEGACPADYSVAFAGEDGVYGHAHEVTDHAGMATFTDFFMPEGTTAVRYIKFLSTKAATQYGVKIFDFSVYGGNKQEIADTAAPTDFTASVVEGSATFSSVSLKLKAADDVSSVISYEISYKEGETDKLVTASGASDAEVTYAVTGLSAGTDYAFSVVAKDGKGNATEPIVLNATTTILEAAPISAQDADDVMSVYSNTYGNAAGFILPNWGEATVTNEMKIGEDDVLMLSNMNYRGLEFAKMDVTEMETLRVDVYPLSANTVTVTPIWRNADDSGNATEIAYAITDLTIGQWNSIDIPLTAFNDDSRNGTNVVYQIKLDNGQGNTFVFDNIYFFKSGVVDEVAPVFAEGYPKAEAALDAVTVFVKGSDENKSQVKFAVTLGDETKTVTANNDEEATVVFSGLEAGEHTFSVTVSDGKNTAEAKTVTATVKALNKIDLNADYVTVDADVNANDMANAFDGTTDTKWQMLPDGKGDLEQGFTVDLRGIYTIDAFVVAFRDACSSTFDVEQLNADKAVVATKTVTGLTAALGEVTESKNAISGAEVRYVKYVSKGSNNAAWGVHMAEFTVYGTKTADIPAEVTTVELTAPEKVKTGTEIAVETAVKDQNGEEFTGETTVSYASSDEEVVAVEDGKFVAKKAGEATITVTVNGVSAQATVTVEDAKATIFNVTADKTTVEVGETINLTVELKDQFGDDMTGVEVAYTVENGLGTVENNVFTAKAAGTGNIIARVDGVEDVMIAITVNNTVGINGIKADAADADTVVYNLAGQRVSKATKGVVIINGKKVIVK